MTLETVSGAAVIEENLKQFLWVLAVSLSVATISQMFSWLRQIPYTLLLVIVGLCLAVLDIRLVELSPELTLLIFLPPLLFEAAWNLEWQDLKQDLVPICLYAIAGVVISVAGVSVALAQFAGLPLATALLVGASLSATDPVAVIALFRELGAGKRITILMEGESLFNDGVAVVAFGLLVGFAVGKEGLSVSSTIAQFFAVVGIGIGVGGLIGFGISYLTQRFDLPLVEQSLTLVAAYGSYLITEDLGGSGVIGVVTTGMILGNFGSRIGMNPRTRMIVTEFWEFLGFFVNSIVFLLIGDQIKFASLGENCQAIGVAIAGIIVTRAIAIYGLGSLSNWLANSQIPWRERTVLWWGGLRGAVSIALVLSVPDTVPGREVTISIVFGVVLFTLLVKGLTTKPLLEKLGLLGDDLLRQQYLTALVRQVALNRVSDRLSELLKSREIQPELYNTEVDLVQKQLKDIESEIKQLQNEHPPLRELAIEKVKVSEEMLSIEGDTYKEFVKAGILNRKPESLLREVLSDIE